MRPARMNPLLGTREIQARKGAAGWRIVDEKLESPIRVVVPKAE